MELQQWLSLQNGSDIRGIAMGDDALLTKEVAGCIGKVFARRVREMCGKESPIVAVGRDSRLTGEELAHAFADGLSAGGCAPVLTGLSSTPSMFMTCIDPVAPADSAVNVTGSHLPKERNGFKFFTPSGGVDSSFVKELLIEAAQTEPPPFGGVYGCKDYMPSYCAHLCRTIRSLTGQERPLDGLRILVDASNGTAGFFVTGVLQPLGADTEGSMHLEPDGHFPGHDPNPEKEEALCALSSEVVARKAHLGIAFDPDADRTALIDETGRAFNRNRLIALIAAVIAPESPGGIVVTDSVTSTGLAHFLPTIGLQHLRFKRGYKNVIDEAVRLCNKGENAPLAIETSGHIALRENHFLDDGAYAAVRLIAALVNCRAEGKSLFDLITRLKEPAEETERRIAFTTPDFKDAGAKLLDAMNAFANEHPALTVEAENHEGVRINVSLAPWSGWYLMRLSLHDPVLAINIESEQAGGIAQIWNLLYEFLQKHSDIIDLN